MNCVIPFWMAFLLDAQTAAAATAVVPPVERIEVRLAQLDVVVRDKKGAIVSGLGSDDFAVFEDGAPMEIVAVDEWGASTGAIRPPTPSEGTAPSTAKSEAASAEGERRSFVLVFDALGDATALRMSQAKHAAKEFVRAHVGSNDVVAVYQLDMALRPVSGVASTVDEIARGIDKISWMPASSLQDQIAESVLSYSSTASTPLMRERLGNLSINAAQQLDWQREHVYQTLTDLTALFAGLPGRRVLILVSPGFPMTTAGDQKSGAGGFTAKFRDLIRSLATYGVTVYSLDIGNDLAAGDVSETIDWRIAVGKLGMDESTLSDLGLERSLGSSSATSRREFLGVIAAESGGRILGQTDLSKAFDAIQEETTRFYRISCRVPVTRAAERYRKLVVKVKTGVYAIASRRGRYSDITPLDRPPTGGAKAVESIDRYRALTARGVAFPLPGVDPKKLPVEVVIEALGPILLPIDAQGGAALDVEIRLVARAAGEVVDRYERSFTARIKPDGVGEVRQGFRVEGRLSLVPGIYEVQGSVRLAEPPQLASWSSTIAVPPPSKAATPSFAGAFVNAIDETPSPLLSRPPVAEASDPLLLKQGVRVLPATLVEFTSGRLLVLFWLRGVPESPEKPPDLDLSVAVADGQGQTITVPTQIVFFGKEPTGGYRAVAQVDATTLTPGAYSIRLAAGVDGSGARRAHHAIAFTILPKEVRPDATTSSSAPAP